jgi:hypothetical protein
VLGGGWIDGPIDDVDNVGGNVLPDRSTRS